MKREEFVENIALGNQLISVGLDDYGQCYFFEYVKDNQLVSSSCGSYNTDYKSEIEYLFGIPAVDCEYYSKQRDSGISEDCPSKLSYGFCDKCEYCDRKWFAFNTLVNLGVVDRRGQVLEPYTHYLVKTDDKS